MSEPERGTADRFGGGARRAEAQSAAPQRQTRALDRRDGIRKLAAAAEILGIIGQRVYEEHRDDRIEKFRSPPPKLQEAVWNTYRWFRRGEESAIQTALEWFDDALDTVIDAVEDTAPVWLERELPLHRARLESMRVAIVTEENVRALHRSAVHYYALLRGERSQTATSHVAETIDDQRRRKGDPRTEDERQVAALLDAGNAWLSILFMHPSRESIFQSLASSESAAANRLNEVFGNAQKATEDFAKSLREKPRDVWRYPPIVLGTLASLGVLNEADRSFPRLIVDLCRDRSDRWDVPSLVAAVVLGLVIIFVPLAGAEALFVMIADLTFGSLLTTGAYLKTVQDERALAASAFRRGEAFSTTDPSWGPVFLTGALTLLGASINFWAWFRGYFRLRGSNTVDDAKAVERELHKKPTPEERGVSDRVASSDRAIGDRATRVPPEQLAALEQRLGADAFKTLSAIDPTEIVRLEEALGPDVLRTLALELDASAIVRLEKQLRPAAVQKLVKDLAPRRIVELLEALGDKALRRLSTGMTGAEIEEYAAALGLDRLRVLTMKFEPDVLKHYGIPFWQRFEQLMVDLRQHLVAGEGISQGEIKGLHDAEAFETFLVGQRHGEIISRKKWPRGPDVEYLEYKLYRHDAARAVIQPPTPRNEIVEKTVIRGLAQNWATWERNFSEMIEAAIRRKTFPTRDGRFEADFRGAEIRGFVRDGRISTVYFDWE